MKSNFLTFILLLILIILMGGTIIIGRDIFIDLFKDESNKETFKLDNVIIENPQQNKESDFENTYTSFNNNIQGISDGSTEENEQGIGNDNKINNFFYNQLTNNEIIIYNGLNENKSNLKQGNYKIPFGDSFSSTLSQEGGDKELGKEYQTAIEAFMHDNPDLFYIDVSKMILNITTTTKFLKTTYNVYIAPTEDSTYLSDDFSNTSEIENAIKQIENIKDDILNKAKGSDYQKILYIHDYLIDNIQYDSTYNQKGTYSIYGALIGKTCVCEGYAKAFKYLVNSAGIQCEFMQGDAINSSGENESHAWNCIKLGNNWYEIDPTWDDPIIIAADGRTVNASKANSARYKYFLKGSSTFQKDHTLSYQFSNNGKKFTYPTICENDY